jgi:hypothetical protein
MDMSGKTMGQIEADLAGPAAQIGARALSANVTETPAPWKFTEQGDG